jgi:hypothetical protein
MSHSLPPSTVRLSSLASLLLVSILACSNAGNQLATDAPDPSSLSLAALSVTTSAGGDSVLVPGFAPEVHDYYVRCAPGANGLTVSMTASPGAGTALLQPIMSTGSPAQTLSLSVQEGEAIVVAATEGNVSIPYWIRCLPADFPTMTVDSQTAAGAPTPGYYLMGNQPVNDKSGRYAMVIDTHGVPVWYHTATGEIWDVDDVVSGAISFRESSAGFEVHHLSPYATNTVTAMGTPIDVHELRALDNGDFLVLSDKNQTGVDLTKFHLPLADGGVQSFGKDETIHPCILLEVDPQGAVVWQWNATDHFDAGEDSTYPRVWSATGGFMGGPVLDPFHCNSIDIDPANGNLLVSARNMDSLFYIDRSTGAVLWKMGGSTFSKDGAAYVPVSDAFHRQHDGRLQPGWSSACSGHGQISLFDDETATSDLARAVLYDVTVGASQGTERCAAAGATVAWQYRGASASGYMGSFRVLGDGSRVIGWGDNGDDGRTLTEVDLDGRVLLDLHFEDGSASYRSIKVPLSSLDLGLLRATAGLP